MQTALDTPSDKLNPHEQEFVGSIREHGWHRTSVLGPNRSGRGAGEAVPSSVTLKSPCALAGAPIRTKRHNSAISRGKLRMTFPRFGSVIRGYHTSL